MDVEDRDGSLGVAVGRRVHSRRTRNLREGGYSVGQRASQAAGHRRPVRHPYDVDPARIDREPGERVVDDGGQIADVVRNDRPRGRQDPAVVPYLTQCAWQGEREARLLAERAETGQSIEPHRVDAAAVEFHQEGRPSRTRARRSLEQIRSIQPAVYEWNQLSSAVRHRRESSARSAPAPRAPRFYRVSRFAAKEYVVPRCRSCRSSAIWTSVETSWSKRTPSSSQR